MISGSFETDKYGKITLISNELEYFIPLPKTLIGNDIEQVLRLIDIDLYSFIQNVFKGTAFEQKLSFNFSDGRQGEVLFSGTPLTGKSHVLSSVFFIFMDTTMEKELLFDRERSRDNMFALLQNSPEGLVVIDNARIIRFLNPVAGQLLGKTEQELTGREYPYPLPKGKRGETDIEREDGTMVIIETRTSPFVWENKPARLILMKDITAEKMVIDGILNVITDAVVFLDKAGKARYYNKPFKKVFHFSGHFDTTAASIIEHIGKYLKEGNFQKNAGKLLSTDETFLDTLHHVEGWVFEWFTRPVFLHKKRIGRIMSFHDTTRQEITERYILRQNRLYATLSVINQMLVRSENIEEMIRETCRIAVDEEGFNTAWIAMVDKDADKIEILPASGGNRDFPRNFSGRLSEAYRAGYPAAKACITGKPVIINDLRQKPVPGKWRSKALKLHFFAMAAYPLRVKGKIRGAFTVCTDDTGIFDKKGKELLKEIAMDISFSIETLENEAARKHAVRQLQENEKKYRTLFQENMAGVYRTSLEGRLLEANERFVRIFGYDSLGELSSHPVKDLYFAEEERDHFVARLQSRKKSPSIERKLKRRDGTPVWILESTVLRQETNEEPYILGTAIDITQRKEAEEKLIQREEVLEIISRYASRAVEGKGFYEIFSDLLKDIGSKLNVSRVYFFKTHNANDGALLSSQVLEWVRESVSLEIGNPELQNIPLLKSGYGRWIELLSKGKPLYGLVKDFPESERPLLESQDILSILILPVMVKRQLKGFIGFDHCKIYHVWTKQEQNTLATLASLTGSILFREETEKQLQKKEARLAEAQEVAGLGYWELDLLTNRLTWSEKIYELFDVTPESFAGTYEAFLTLVHPDDRDMVDRTFRESVKNKKPYSIVHRVVDNKGRIKWVWEKGQSFYDKKGKALRTVGTVMDVTDRESAREEIGWLSRVVEEGPASVVITDNRGKIVFVNKRFTELSGYASEEAMGKTMGQLVKSGTHDDSFYQKMWRTILASEKWVGEIKNKRKDGTMFWVTSSISALKNSRGEITHLVGINEDITEKKELENFSNALTASAREMEKAFTADDLFDRTVKTMEKSGIKSIYYSYNEEDKKLVLKSLSLSSKALKAAEALAGTQHRAFTFSLGKSPLNERVVRNREIVFSDAVDQEISAATGLKNTYIPQQIVKLLGISKVIGAPVIHNDRVVGIIQVLADSLKSSFIPYVSTLANQLSLALRKVTLLEELQEAKRKLDDSLRQLQASEKKYREFFEKDISANYISTPEGKVLDCNPAFVYLFGFRSREEALNTNLSLLYPDKTSRQKFLAYLQEQKQVEYYDQAFMTLQGRKRYILKNAVGRFDQQGKLMQIHAYLWDVTKLKKTEEKLIKALEKAQESERLKTAFLTNMSHEIRTPINAIVGFSTLLGEQNLQPQVRDEYIRYINTNINQLLSLLDDIINLSKIESGLIQIDYQPLDLNQLLHDVYQTFSIDNRLSKREISMKLDIDHRQKKNINGNPVRIREILDNLISNAIKFTPSGSIHFGYEQTGNDMLKFYVRDTGIGVPKHLHKLIFERFRQADNELTREYEGVGLGLAICKSYLEMMGGKIWVESLAGKGSTFYFTLPENPVTKFSKDNKIS